MATAAAAALFSRRLRIVVDETTHLGRYLHVTSTSHWIFIFLYSKNCFLMLLALFAEQGLCNSQVSVRPSACLSVCPLIDSSNGVRLVCC